MSQDCLLLNGNGRPVSYLPLSVLNWKTAIKLSITRDVIVIKEHADWVVRSPSVEMKVPSILMLQSYHPFHSYVKFSRTNVFLRDLYTCQYCFDIFEKKDLTMDHVVPKCRNGGSNWENVVTACKRCNLQKSDKDIFSTKYIQMLSSGGTKSHNDLLKPFNLSAYDNSFWEKGISMITGLMDELDDLDN